jgi:hypothetical protein
MWLFYNADSAADVMYCRVTYGSMPVNDELEVMWKQFVVDYFKVISQYLAGRTEENLQSE